MNLFSFIFYFNFLLIVSVGCKPSKRKSVLYQQVATSQNEVHVVTDESDESGEIINLFLTPEAIDQLVMEDNRSDSEESFDSGEELVDLNIIIPVTDMTKLSIKTLPFLINSEFGWVLKIETRMEKEKLYRDMNLDFSESEGLNLNGITTKAASKQSKGAVNAAKLGDTLKGTIKKFQSFVENIKSNRSAKNSSQDVDDLIFERTDQRTTTQETTTIIREDIKTTTSSAKGILPDAKTIGDATPFSLKGQIYDAAAVMQSKMALRRHNISLTKEIMSSSDSVIRTVDNSSTNWSRAVTNAPTLLKQTKAFKEFESAVNSHMADMKKMAALEEEIKEAASFISKKLEQGLPIDVIQLTKLT